MAKLKTRPVAPVIGVSAALIAQQDSLESLFTKLDELRDRLDSVLRSEPRSAEVANTKAGAGGSNITVRVDAATSRIYEASAQIEDLLRGLDL